MKEMPDFLKSVEDEGITKEDMQSLDGLIKAYNEAFDAVENAERILKLAKGSFNRIALEAIPEFLLSHGVTKMSLTDGREVKIKEDISVTIKDELAFRKWLKDRGEDYIIKTKYTMGKMDTSKIVALSDYLADGDYDYDVDESIHAQTKKKYFKELIKDIGRDELPEWANIYDIRKAVIK